MSAKICGVQQEVHAILVDVAQERRPCDNPDAVEVFDTATKEIEAAVKGSQDRYEVFADQWGKMVAMISQAPQDIVKRLVFKRADLNAGRMSLMIFRDLQRILSAAQDAAYQLQFVGRICYLD